MMKDIYKDNLDFHIVIIWYQGIDYFDEIYDVISKKFDIIFLKKLKWGSEYKHSYLSRLYSNINESYVSSKVKKSGSNPFILFLIQDNHPHYALRYNISGKIPSVNVNITNLKEQLRSKVGGNFIHSTDNPHEFKLQSTLLLGSDFVQKIIFNSSRISKSSYYIDNYTFNKFSIDYKFSNLNNLFYLLNKCIEYCIINYSDNFFSSRIITTITFLVKDKSDFVSFIGAKQINKSQDIYEIMISNTYVRLTIYELNDYSIDPLFQYEMLKNTKVVNNIKFIREEFYTIYLLNSLLIKKKSRVLVEQLTELLQLCGPSNFDKNKFINSKKYRVKLLDGYYREKNYKVMAHSHISFFSLIYLTIDRRNTANIMNKIILFCKEMIRKVLI